MFEKRKVASCFLFRNMKKRNATFTLVQQDKAKNQPWQQHKVCFGLRV